MYIVIFHKMVDSGQNLQTVEKDYYLQKKLTLIKLKFKININNQSAWLVNKIN